MTLRSPLFLIVLTAIISTTAGFIVARMTSHDSLSNAPNDFEQLAIKVRTLESRIAVLEQRSRSTTAAAEPANKSQKPGWHPFLFNGDTYYDIQLHKTP